MEDDHIDPPPSAKEDKVADGDGESESVKTSDREVGWIVQPDADEISHMSPDELPRVVQRHNHDISLLASLIDSGDFTQLKKVRDEQDRILATVSEIKSNQKRSDSSELSKPIYVVCVGLLLVGVLSVVALWRSYFYEGDSPIAGLVADASCGQAKVFSGSHWLNGNTLRYYENQKNAAWTEVDTSAASMTSTPTYLASISANGGQWSVVGVNAVYRPERDSFRLYIKWYDGNTKDIIQYSDRANWILNWVAIGCG